MGDLYRSPDGAHYEVCGTDVTGPVPTYTLEPVRQDPDTRRWRGAAGGRVTLDAEALRQWTPVEREPRRDPRITRLAALVTALLADYETATGAPAASAEEIRAALAELEVIPEESARRMVGVMRQVSRNRMPRGRRGRSA